MARRSDFTSDEWQTLERGVTGTAVIVSGAEGGPLAALREAKAFASELARARRSSGSGLVHDLSTVRLVPLNARVSASEVEQATLQALREAVAILRVKAPDELDAYRALVRDVAAAVSGAAGSPGLLGRAALRLADAADAERGECETLARIEAALDAAP